MKNILIIIPARGGSKGIPRKNLRLLNGKPLIFYSIIKALKSSCLPDVYVTTEDDEIAVLAKKMKAKVHKRPLELADDVSTLDPVIYNALIYAELNENKVYDFVITMQPTSPLLETKSIDDAIKLLSENSGIETIISAQDDTHLSWKREKERYLPNYEKRLNRQYLTPIYRETGGFLITRRELVTENNRIGKSVELFLLSNGEEIDIDTFNDWNLCEYILKKKKILFVVSGNKTIGLGHVYNTLILANDILDHDIEFLVTKDSSLAFDQIKSKNYKVKIQQNEDILADIKNLCPNVVINDILDTNLEYMKALKALNIKVINFEDLGEGAKLANLVVNAIYPEKIIVKNHFFGENYFVLRDEFIFNYAEKKIGVVNEILITFGGVDPCNLTELTLRSVYNYCLANQIKINIVTGLGYNKYDTLKPYKEINIHKNVQNISDYMFDADVIFTSAGRTIYEIASIGTPSIVLAQNERELTHFFASEKFGFLNLGLGKNINELTILEQFVVLVESVESRKEKHNLMLQQNLKLGRKRVQKLISNVIQ